MSLTQTILILVIPTARLSFEILKWRTERRDQQHRRDESA